MVMRLCLNPLGNAGLNINPLLSFPFFNARFDNHAELITKKKIVHPHSYLSSKVFAVKVEKLKLS